MLFFAPDPDLADTVCAKLPEKEREIFYSGSGTGYKTAKAICNTRCPRAVRVRCLEIAMDFERDEDWRFGVWGGLSAAERKRLAKGVA